ncbi:transposase [Pseudomonadota bacterium]
MQRGNNRDIIFATEEDYRFYLECLKDAATRQQLEIHAYVLMTNHVHLLATPAKDSSLPRTFVCIQ